MVLSWVISSLHQPGTYDLYLASKGGKPYKSKRDFLTHILHNTHTPADLFDSSAICQKG